MEMIMKFIQESNTLWNVAKDIGCWWSVLSKYANIKECGGLKKLNILVDHEIHVTAKIENSKQYS